MTDDVTDAERIQKLERRVAQLQGILSFLQSADTRAIQRWHEMHPGQDRVWPARRQLISWLIDRADHLEGILSRIVLQVEDQANGHHTLSAFRFGAGIDDAKIALAFRSMENGDKPA